MLVLDFADPGGIGGTVTGSSLPRSPGPRRWRCLRGRRRGAAVRVCRLGRSRSRGGRRPDVRYEEPGRAPGDWLAVLSPWWPGLLAVNRAWASSSWAAIMSLTSASSGVCPQARPEIRAACWAAMPSPGGTVSADVSGPGLHCVGQSSARRWISRSVSGPRELDAIYPFGATDWRVRVPSKSGQMRVFCVRPGAPLPRRGTHGWS